MLESFVYFVLRVLGVLALVFACLWGGRVVWMSPALFAPKWFKVIMIAVIVICAGSLLLALETRPFWPAFGAHFRHLALAVTNLGCFVAACLVGMRVHDRAAREGDSSSSAKVLGWFVGIVLCMGLVLAVGTLDRVLFGDLPYIAEWESSDPF